MESNPGEQSGSSTSIYKESEGFSQKAETM